MTMNDIFNRIGHCVEFGKINRTSPYPPDMRDQDGADELTRQALDEGIYSRNSIIGSPHSGYGKSWR